LFALIISNSAGAIRVDMIANFNSISASDIEGSINRDLGGKHPIH
jgi:hypothetical protein